MGTIREVTHRKSKTASSLGLPVWLGQADSLPNRDFITPSEKRLIDLVRKHGDFTKADLAVSTDYSRTKITNCVDSLLNKQIIVANNTEYSGGRRSKTFGLNEKLGCSGMGSACGSPITRKPMPL